ncbi:MAG: right-handed parallel beta-helix repeat-containing protein [Candidatus Hodarchaeales archaeon]
MEVKTLLAYNFSNEIDIDGNNDFQLQAALKGWDKGGSLNGSKLAPYVIDNLNITPATSSNPAIKIRNTNLYFNISNCLIHNGTYGIWLKNVTSATITNNIIENNSYEGVLIDNSTDIIFSHNYVTQNGYEGIRFEQSKNNTLGDCIINNNGKQGAKISYSLGCTLQNNILHDNNADGFLILHSNFTILINNTIYNNYGGSIVHYSANCSINELTIFKVMFTGLELYNSPYAIINDVKISCSFGLNVEESKTSILSNIISTNNNKTGIRIYTSEKSNISNILSLNNKNDGFYLGYSENSRIEDIHSENNSEKGFQVTYSDNLLLENITCKNNGIGGYSDTGFAISFSSYLTMRQILSAKNTGHGLILEDCNNSVIEDSEFFSNLLGIYMIGSNYNEFKNNFVNNNNLTGIYIGDFGTGSNIGNTFTGNYVYENGVYGFDISNTKRINISKNVIYRNLDAGIYAANDIEGMFKNSIHNNDLIANKVEFRIFEQIKIENVVNPDNWNINSNFYDTFRVPDSNNDGRVDFRYICGIYWDGETEEYIYDCCPRTNPINVPSSVHYMTTPVILSPSSFNIEDLYLSESISLNGTVSVEFLPVIDSHNHTITYSLFYTKNWDILGKNCNDFKNWTMIVSNISETTYNWDVTKVPDGMLALGILANCSEGLGSFFVETSLYVDNTPRELSEILATPFPHILYVLASFIVLEQFVRKMVHKS